MSENLRIVVKCTLFVHLPGKIPYSSVHFTQLLSSRLYKKSLVLSDLSIVENIPQKRSDVIMSTAKAAKEGNSKSPVPPKLMHLSITYTYTGHNA